VRPNKRGGESLSFDILVSLQNLHAYSRTGKSKDVTFSLDKILLRLCPDLERSLPGALVRGRLDLGLVLVHDLFHDVAQGSGLAILGGGEVDDVELERFGEHGLGDGFDARSSTPARLDGSGGGSTSSSGGSRRRERREGDFRPGVGLLLVRSITLRFLLDGSVLERRERVWCSFKLVLFLYARYSSQRF
jgi:hypothetical protein